MKFCVYDKEYLPVKATEGSAGYDVKSAERVIIPPKQIAIIKTGVKAVIDEGYCLKEYFRSSTPIRKGLVIPNGVGIIDSDYRGEICVEVYNTKYDEVIIDKGERIAQLVPVKLDTLETENIHDSEMRDNFEKVFLTERGKGGFGSTGK